MADFCTAVDSGPIEIAASRRHFLPRSRPSQRPRPPQRNATLREKTWPSFEPERVRSILPKYTDTSAPTTDEYARATRRLESARICPTHTAQADQAPWAFVSACFRPIRRYRAGVGIRPPPHDGRQQHGPPMLPQGACLRTDDAPETSTSVPNRVMNVSQR